MQRSEILIAFGSNLRGVHGKPKAEIESAFAILPDFGIKLLKTSRLYRTPAVSPHEQPDFVNAVAAVDTELDAEGLLAQLHEVENLFGRVRTIRWGERVLDLDLLDFRGAYIPATGKRGADAGTGKLPLALPHPAIRERAFVLLPLRDVAPEWRHPVTGEPVNDLIAALPPESFGGIEALS